MPRLFFTAPDGEDGTQISVQSIGQGPTRQVASVIDTDDLPAGLALPPGDFEGQALFWNGVAWVPVPAGGTQIRIDGFTSVDPSPSSVVIGVGSVAISGVTAQLNDNLSQAFVLTRSDRFEANYNDGVAPIVRVIGDATGLLAEATEAGNGGFLMVSPALSALDNNAGGETRVSSDLNGALVTAPPGTAGMPPDVSLWMYVPVEGVPTGLVQFSQTEGGATVQIGSNAGARVTFNDGAAVLLSPATSIGSDGGLLGFLGAIAVARPSITGVLVQDQVNSIVAALVALGLVTDDR